MRSSSLFAVTGAVLATALLSQGCRTLNRSRDRVTADDIPFESVSQPSRIARSTASTAPVAVAPVVVDQDVESPSVSEPVAPVSVPVPSATPVAQPVYREPVVAERLPMDTTPYEVQVVKSADEVGKPGSYIEQVLPEDGADRAYLIEADGLTGSTGRHTPAPAPEPEPVPVVKQAPAGSGVYVVQPGDILGRIALKHGVSRQAILDANPSIKDPNKLKIGQKIKIPPRGTGITDKPKAKKVQTSAVAKPKKSLPAKEGFMVYTVKKGDILGRIAIANKTTTKAILEANGLANADRIREGQQLYIPATGAAAPKAGAEPAPKPDAKSAPRGKTVKVVDKPAAEPPAPAADQSTDDILRSLGL